MIVLALDTACASCSVAVVQHDGGPGPGAILAARGKEMARGQAEALMPMVSDAMAAAGLDFAALDLVAATVGPGSFTGLRTGLATARALGLARDVPVAGVTTLEAVAASAHTRRIEDTAALPVLAALETRRVDLYVQLFAPDGKPATDPLAAVAEDALRLAPGGGALVAGDGAPRLLGAASLSQRARLVEAPEIRVPDAATVAVIAARRIAAPLAAAPLYIHPPAVRLPEAGNAR